MEKEIIAPVLNLNGASFYDLRQDYMDTYHAIQKAVDKLCLSRPHPRDFQTVDPGVWKIAHDQHQARINALLQAQAEIENIVNQLQEQHRGRR